MNKLPAANLEFVREDDYVEYFIFPQLKDDPGNEEQLRQELNAVRAECIRLVEQKIAEREYIWHKDEFQLQVRTGSAQEHLLNDETNEKEAAAPTGMALPAHLHGVTHYGDNMADEWFIVYLVSELTRSLKDCIARVHDADGEFLLIEAADVLPDWANPDSCEQRVYLAEGTLQLVQNSPSNTAKVMSVASALSKIRMNPTLYRVSKDIQACIDMRLQEFIAPSRHLALHRQIVQLPLNAAALLKQRPGLIAATVRAFCDRDSLDSKALRVMRYFPPEAQRVRTNVTFTRCLYAMLMHSQYTPERKVGWNLSTAIGSNKEDYKEQLLGVKLSCGLEILATQAKQIGDDNIEETPAWRSYLRSLKAKGYFRDLLEGSEEHKRLLSDALNYYKGNEARFRTAPRVGAEILGILRSGELNADQLRDDENNLQPSDSDDWLNISAEELDAMLAERYGPKKLYTSNGDINAAEFTKNLNDFLEKESNFEGIEETGLDSDDDEVDDDEDTASSSQKRNKEAFKAKVKKNASMRRACQQNTLLDVKRRPQGKQTSATVDGAEEEVSTHVRNFLDFVIPEDNWDSNSEMSDYEDEVDLERNFDAMSANAEFSLDRDIREYMAQMDRELAKTNVGKTFKAGGSGGASKVLPTAVDDEDDFDDIESFQPIDINVNTLKNMLDSYQAQIGGTGPVSHLFSAMGVGMSTASTEGKDCDAKDLSESRV